MNDDGIPNGLIQALTSASAVILVINFAFWPIYAPYGPEEPPWELKHIVVVAPLFASVSTVFLSLFFTLNPNNRKASDFQISRVLILLSFALFMFAVIASALPGQTWNLYIYTGDDEQTYVSAKIPSECSGASNIRYLSMYGKKRPAELSMPYRIDDVDAWLHEYEGKGFSFAEQQ
jgi:hypothetical protein